REPDRRRLHLVSRTPLVFRRGGTRGESVKLAGNDLAELARTHPISLVVHEKKITAIKTGPVRRAQTVRYGLDLPAVCADAERVTLIREIPAGALSGRENKEITCRIDHRTE